MVVVVVQWIKTVSQSVGSWWKLVVVLWWWSLSDSTISLFFLKREEERRHLLFEKEQSGVRRWVFTVYHHVPRTVQNIASRYIRSGLLALANAWRTQRRSNYREEGRLPPPPLPVALLAFLLAVLALFSSRASKSLSHDFRRLPFDWGHWPRPVATELAQFPPPPANQLWSVGRGQGTLLRACFDCN